jgi:hypothetical protein
MSCTGIFTKPKLIAPLHIHLLETARSAMIMSAHQEYLMKYRRQRGAASRVSFLDKLLSSLRMGAQPSVNFECCANKIFCGFLPKHKFAKKRFIFYRIGF